MVLSYRKTNEQRKLLLIIKKVDTSSYNYFYLFAISMICAPCVTADSSIEFLNPDPNPRWQSSTLRATLRDISNAAVLGD